MRTSVIGTVALVARALAGDAPESTGNPPGVVYEAVLPDKPFFPSAAIEGNVKGSITAVAREDGQGVRFTVMFENLPKEGGPFPYHIHKAAAVDGNCTTTLTHLDPFGAGVAVPCNPDAPQTCEVGDLSGKHGKVDSDPYEKHYVDLYASTNPESESYFGNLSFVLHYANNTRLTCANFARKEVPMPTPGEQDCSTDAPDATGTPIETSAGVPESSMATMMTSIMSESITNTVTPTSTETNSVQVPCEKDCNPDENTGGSTGGSTDGGVKGDEGGEGGNTGENMPCEKDCEGGQGGNGDSPGNKPDDDNNSNAEDGTTSVMPPSPQDTESAPAASTPSVVSPVTAGASVQQLSMTVLSLGFVAALVTRL